MTRRWRSWIGIQDCLMLGGVASFLGKAAEKPLDSLQSIQVLACLSVSRLE